MTDNTEHEYQRIMEYPSVTSWGSGNLKSIETKEDFKNIQKNECFKLSNSAFYQIMISDFEERNRKQKEYFKEEFGENANSFDDPVLLALFDYFMEC